jgi:hypothetical protein
MWGGKNMAKSPDVHDRHQPSVDEDFDTAPEKTKTIQEVRDAHFLEPGVDVHGRTPKGLAFDAEGNPHKVEERDNG